MSHLTDIKRWNLISIPGVCATDTQLSVIWYFSNNLVCNRGPAPSSCTNSRTIFSVLAYSLSVSSGFSDLRFYWVISMMVSASDAQEEERYRCLPQITVCSLLEIRNRLPGKLLLVEAQTRYERPMDSCWCVTQSIVDLLSASMSSKEYLFLSEEYIYVCSTCVALWASILTVYLDTLESTLYIAGFSTKEDERSPTVLLKNRDQRYIINDWEIRSQITTIVLK